MGKKYCLVTVIGFFVHCMVCAQTGNLKDSTLKSSPGDSLTNDQSGKKNYFIVSEIVITGAKKTKSYIIERELPFKTGDSVVLNDLVKKFERARNQLMNTRLFNEVVVALKGFKGYFVEIQVDVKERWYIFPVPYFKLADRNLSEWAKQGYELKRSNYGAKLEWYNFSGRNDKLKAWFVTGYTRRIQVAYEQPYADKSLKHGYNIDFSYSTAKELNHMTVNNEQRFIPIDKSFNPPDSITSLFKGQVLNEVFNFSVGYTYRPAIRTKHAVTIGYNVNRVDEAVVKVAPGYFNNNQRYISYPFINYSIQYVNVDYVAYALKGFMGDAELSKRGINKDLNIWQLSFKGTKGFQLADKTFYGLQAYGILKLPFDQPFSSQRMFGYGDMYLRGLEKYVIDGVAGLMIRNTIRQKVTSFDIPFSFSKSHSTIPFRVYVKAFGDMGYSYNKNYLQNSLVNKMMYTTGAGVDFVTLYDIVFRFEYSFNQLGQKGLFLHFKSDF